MQEGSWDPQALLQACHAGTRMVILNTPHNPTGTVCPPGFLDALADHIEGFDTLVLSDEVYGPIVHDGRARSLHRSAMMRLQRAWNRFWELWQIAPPGHRLENRLGRWACGLDTRIAQGHQYDVFSTGAPLQAALEAVPSHH